MDIMFEAAALLPSFIWKKKFDTPFAAFALCLYANNYQVAN
jgi:hypothetical protein